MENKVERKKKFIINVVFYALIAVLVWVGCKYLVSPMMPFIIAFLVAALIQVPVRKFKVSKKQKKLLSIVFCAVFYGLLLLLAAWVSLKLLDGVENLIRQVPHFYNTTIVPVFETISNYLEESMTSVHPSVANTIENSFEEMTINLGSYVSSLSVKVVQIISGGISGVPGFVIKLVITVVATFFFVGDYDGIIAFFKKLLTPKQVALVEKGQSYVKNVLFIYIRSYSFLFLLTFTELCIGMFLLKMPYPALLALCIAVFDILPVLGTGGVLLPWAAILFIMKEHGLAVGILILYLVILVVRNMVEPRIVGKQIGLHPLATLAALFLGLKLFGLVGLVAFPVALTVLVKIIKIYTRRNIKELWPWDTALLFVLIQGKTGSACFILVP